MRISVRGLVAMAAFLTACSPSGNKEQNGTVQTEDPKAAFAEFFKGFGAISLPYALPNPDAATAKKEISRTVIASLFSHHACKPVFDAKDVPDLVENMQSANYFNEGMWQTDGYQAFLIHKIDGDDYYYLATFNKDGQFVDGMCIAFQVGDEGGKTERRASINDDQSIQIRQFDAAAEKGAAGQNAFYEIATDGRIVPMKSGDNSPQPA